MANYPYQTVCRDISEVEVDIFSFNPPGSLILKRTSSSNSDPQTATLDSQLSCGRTELTATEVSMPKSIQSLIILSRTSACQPGINNTIMTVLLIEGYISNLVKLWSGNAHRVGKAQIEFKGSQILALYNNGRSQGFNIYHHLITSYQSREGLSLVHNVKILRCNLLLTD